MNISTKFLFARFFMLTVGFFMLTVGFFQGVTCLFSRHASICAGHVLRFCLVISLFYSIMVNATSTSPVHISSVSVCLDVSKNTQGTLTKVKNCGSVSINQVDPKQSLVWIQVHFDVANAGQPRERPLGLVLSAEASTTVYLNGVKIGRNGSPAEEAKNEVAGRIDKSFYLPDSLLIKQHNTLVIELSSHNRLLQIDPPIQRLLITDYQTPKDYLTNHYLPVFIPLGILIIGFIYSSVLALQSNNTKQNLFIPVASLFAVIQLIAEISRGLFDYSYPYNGIRMLTILCSSLIVSFFLLSYVCKRFLTQRRKTALTVGCVTTLISVLLLDHFESKTLASVLLPMGIGTLITGYAAIKKARNALPHSIALFAFVLLTASSPNQFLDIYYYYCIALLFVFFFAQHAIDYKKEQEEKRFEQNRADRLQRILDEQKEREQPTRIKISHAGKTDFTSCEEICFCKGARDYVELVINNRGSVLHHNSLSELESTLPATFLRVHRSYIVNTQFITSLSRSASGTGILHLSTGDEVPVSRRIMPKVRDALG
ncbi:LytR/AlgR family response regulator transcription factor [Pseudoalteromonas sp. NJ631]|uniref:LytR/AlgR family response regulator transcription factor n=1 Tax=Pseudoalteromonas sp. NJ631 TaxID=493915 RepID=UPI0009FFB946|nr:LytTR family DNA-binding domain-containing protein [Pseudoalteromonas sp. NJ631]